MKAHLGRTGIRRPALPAAVCALAVALLGGLGAGNAEAKDAHPGPPLAEPAVPAEQLVRTAAAGKPVALQGAVVTGDVDLTSAGSVFACRQCRFTGQVRAANVIFSRLVDLTSSIFEGGFVTTGAEFKGDLVLEGARFAGPATFARAVVAGSATFSDARFHGDAIFSGTSFGSRADFVKSRFDAPAAFPGASFGGPFSFSLASFGDRANFSGAVAREAGNFRFTRFLGTDPDMAVAFDDVIAQAPLDFTGVQFSGGAGFTNLTSSSSVTMKDLRFDHQGKLFMDQLAVRDLAMAVGAVSSIRGLPVQKQVLQLIETSAQSRGNLGTANDARFQLLTLSNLELDGLRRVLDSVFYRDIAGYLVRPSHPLAAFALLLVVGGLVRSLPRQWEITRSWWQRRPDIPRRGFIKFLVHWPHRAVLGLQKVVTAALFGLAGAFTVAFQAKPSIEIRDPEKVRSYFLASARWAEFLAFKVLIGIFVLSLGNSNASIRQILDSIRS